MFSYIEAERQVRKFSQHQTKSPAYKIHGVLRFEKHSLNLMNGSEENWVSENPKAARTRG